MKLKLATIGLIISLVGCSSVSQSVPDLRVDPSWPDPIQKYDNKWQVKVIDGKAWVGMPFEDSQQFRIWLNDVYRYVKDANGMICYYRADLKEPRCIK